LSLAENSKWKGRKDRLNWDLNFEGSLELLIRRNGMMRFWISPIIAGFLLTTALQVRLTHDNKKGYSYQISGPSVEEVMETDQKMRQYLKNLAPPKKKGPAPSISVPKPPLQKK
jgi:hypothetical protein